jgi:hypothetical protein
MNAAINLLEDFNSDGFTERNINQMTGMTEKMHDGPMKSFLKILGIAATTFIGFKGATSKAAKALTKNATIQKKIIAPITKFVSKQLDKLTKFLNKNEYLKENAKGVKPFIYKNVKRGLDALKSYGEKGTEKLLSSIDDQLKTIRKELKEIGKVNTSRAKELKEQAKMLTERKKLVATENLITKVTTNVAAAGAGAEAAVIATKDSDENGIADICED